MAGPAIEGSVLTSSPIRWTSCANIPPSNVQSRENTILNLEKDRSTCPTPRCRAYLRIWPQGLGFICDQGDPVVCKYVAILLGFSNFHFFFMACSLVTGYLYIVRFPDPLAIGPGT